MRKRVLCMFTLMLTTSVVIAEEVRDTEAMRTWTDTSGRQIRARYAPDLASEQDAGMVVLFSENNKVIKIKPERLVKPDQEYLEGLVSAEEAFGTANDEDVNLASAETMNDGPNPDRVMTVNSPTGGHGVSKKTPSDEDTYYPQEESPNLVDREFNPLDETNDPLDVRIVDNSTQRGLYAAFIDTKVGADGTGIGYRTVRAKSPSRKFDSRMELYSLEATFSFEGDFIEEKLYVLIIEGNSSWSYDFNDRLSSFFGFGYNFNYLMNDEPFSMDDRSLMGLGIGGQVRVGMEIYLNKNIAVFFDYTFRATKTFTFGHKPGDGEYDTSDDYDPDVDLSSRGFNGSLGILLTW